MNFKSISLSVCFILLIVINVSSSENKKSSGTLSVVSPELTTVKIHPFTQQKKDPHISWVTITTERKIIELLYNSDVTVFSPLTRFQAYTEPTFHIIGNVGKKESIITALVSLINSKGDTISSCEINGTIELFRNIRNVIGETVLYAFDVDKKNLKSKKIKKKPTSSNSAYALYLKAKMKLRAEQPDKAIACLTDALKEDSAFAMACWTISQIYNNKGVKDSVILWNKRANKIDKAHPRWPHKDQINKSQPLSDLLTVSGKQEFKIVDKGMYCKHVVLDAHNLSAAIWIIDPHIFSIDMAMQQKSTGNHIAEFLTDSNTVLAVNGGFFEMDSKHILSPSGLIAKNGKELFPVTDHGGSGVFSITNGKPEILWSKDSLKQDDCNLAFQSGPVLVEHGGKIGILNNDYKRLNRAAIGISKNNVIISIVAGNNGDGLSLYEFAKFLLTSKDKGGAGCEVALNLDGGSSTQACFSYRDVAISVNGLWAINSAIVVRKKDLSVK